LGNTDQTELTETESKQRIKKRIIKHRAVWDGWEWQLHHGYANEKLHRIFQAVLLEMEKYFPFKF
jgi:hypothetical protein